MIDLLEGTLDMFVDASAKGGGDYLAEFHLLRTAHRRHAQIDRERDEVASEAWLRAADAKARKDARKDVVKKLVIGFLLAAVGVLGSKLAETMLVGR